MKHCTYCGKDYPDDLAACPIDGKTLVQPGAPSITSTQSVSTRQTEAAPSNEQHFWEEMDLQKFAAFLIRLQAVWLVFYALIDVTYLPSYFVHDVLRSSSTSHVVGSTFLRPGFFTIVLRIILRIAAAILAVQSAERIVGWLVPETASSGERHFGEQRYFKQLTVFLLRLQAAWLGFEALLSAMSLPNYFSNNIFATSSPSYAALKPGFWMLILRIILYLAISVSLIRNTERILGWLVRNYEAKKTLK